MPIFSNYLKISSMMNQAAAHEKKFAPIGNLRIILFVLSVVSLFSYLVVVNRTNTMGYEIAEMQLKVQQLEKDQRDLLGLSTELQAMPRIQAMASAQLSMVKADNFSYLGPAQTSVAIK